jgi:hypothetical protein
MSDIKLFRIGTGTVNELTGTTDTIEKSVQTLFEKNLEALLGVRLLASEFTTTNGGRIDTLGLDENGCPVILEYKRALNENVINQGLFYLDWLMDHRKDFQWLVLEKLGKKDAEGVDWSAPRLICIAGDFNKYDDHAVKQMQRNIELIRYRRFGPELLMLDLVAATSVKGSPSLPVGTPGGDGTGAGAGKYDRSIGSNPRRPDGARRRRAGDDAAILHRLQANQELCLLRISTNGSQDTAVRQSRSREYQA